MSIFQIFFNSWVKNKKKFEATQSWPGSKVLLWSTEYGKSRKPSIFGGCFFIWPIYVHWTLASPFFVSKWHPTWAIRCEIVFQTTFLLDVFPRNTFFCRKTQKTEKKFFSATVGLKKCSFSVFRVFRRRNAFLGKTLWRKVVRNEILHQIAKVDFYFDKKIGTTCP